MSLQPSEQARNAAGKSTVRLHRLLPQNGDRQGHARPLWSPLRGEAGCSVPDLSTGHFVSGCSTHTPTHQTHTPPNTHTPQTCIYTAHTHIPHTHVYTTHTHIYHTHTHVYTQCAHTPTERNAHTCVPTQAHTTLTHSPPSSIIESPPPMHGCLCYSLLCTLMPGEPYILLKPI